VPRLTIFAAVRRAIAGVRRRPAADAEALPELEDSDWLRHTGQLIDARFWVIARRLPALVRQALGLAWRASRVDTAVAIGLNVVAGLLTAFGLLATRGVLQALFTAGPTAGRVRAAVPALILVAAATAARAGLSIAAGFAQARLEPQLNRVVERRLFEITSRVELAAFDDAGMADDMDRARRRGLVAVRYLVDRTINLVTGTVGVLAVAGTLLVLHPLLLPVLLLAAVPRGWAAVRVARAEYVSLFQRVARRRRIWMLSDLMANRHTAAELRAYGMRGFLLGEYDRVMRAETHAELAVVRAQTGARLAGGVLAGAASAGVYAVLGLLLIAGAVPLAAAGTAVLALQAGRASLELLMANINGVYEESLYVGDFNDFCDRGLTRIPDRLDSGPLPPPAEVTATGVGLRYPDTDRWALREVSLRIGAGETIALVGENGSGKTSFAKLLAGLYQPTEGQLAWDGRPLAGVDPDAVRAHVAVISQDWWRWPFTARQNITIGRYQRTDGDPTVAVAAAAAGAHDMITALPDGYETLLDRSFKGGQDLSGGQWQRLVAARGFYRDASILICDEPSAALDARAEHALFAHLRRRAGQAITILITHRLANVRHADRIYVLHDGHLVEQGSHDDLVAAGGRYATLFALQSAGYLPDTDAADRPA